MKRATIICLLLFSSLFYGRSIYDDYDHGVKFKAFDKLMNEVRFPSNDKKLLNEWIQELVRLTPLQPDYPQLSTAHYFIGAYSYELKDFSTALEHLTLAKKLDSSLEKSTPINKFIETAIIHEQNSRRIFRNGSIVVAWIIFLSALALLTLKKGSLSRRVYKCTALFITISTLIILLCFMIDTSDMVAGMEEFYLPPVLVKSTMLDTNASPLINLFYYGFFTVLVTALSIIASRCLKPNKRYVLNCLTPLIIGFCLNEIYSTKHWKLSKETGGTFQRISFPEKPILWHRDVPDEMIPMFDEEMQLTIKEKKLQQKEEK